MRLAFDIETTGLDPHTDEFLLISFVSDTGIEEVFEKQIPDKFIKLLENEKVLKIAHNASFDIKWIKHLFGVDIRNIWDTKGIERLLTAGKNLDCDLKNVALRRTGETLDKSIREGIVRSGGLITNKEKEYCLKDSKVLLPIQAQQYLEARSNKQLYAVSIENYLSIIVAEMELYGVLFDCPLWNNYVRIIEEKISLLQKEIWEELGMSYSVDIFGNAIGGVSLNSRDKILPALQKIGIKLEDYTSKTLYSFVLENTDNQKGKLINKILEYKKWSKALSWDYINNVNQKTGRIHPSFNSQGADTFRFSSSGPNLQQVTKPFDENVNFRHLFKAQPGYKIIGADYSQIELRILAELTDEPALVKAFCEGVDMHTSAAESILGRPLKDKKERNLGKAVNFGVRAYGGGPPALIGMGLKYGMLISPADAKKYVKKIKDADKFVSAWGQRKKTEMIKNGFLQTPIGHRRYLIGEDRESVAMNTDDQMFAAGILKDGLCSLHKRLKKEYPKVRIILQVHDELILECPEEEAEQVKSILEEEMNSAGKRWVHKIPVSVDSYISNTWEK